MPYLPNNSKIKGNKLVGASMPLRVHNYLEIYTLAKGISKSKLLSSFVYTFIKEQEKKGETEERLIKVIAQRVTKEWKDRKKRYPSLLFRNYETGLIQELIRKGLNQTQIEKILGHIKVK